MSELYDEASMVQWRVERINHILAHYGDDYFKNKTVLEVAAAWGHIGGYFANNLGANVFCSDQSEEWVNIIKERYPNVNAFVQNINDPWNLLGHFCVLIHMGVIYHQDAASVEPRLLEACQICDDLILETDLVHNDDPYYIEAIPKPPQEHQWEFIPSDYCKPSVAYMERILDKAGMAFTRIDYTPNRSLWFAKHK